MRAVVPGNGWEPDPSVPVTTPNAIGGVRRVRHERPMHGWLAGIGEVGADPHDVGLDDDVLDRRPVHSGVMRACAFRALRVRVRNPRSVPRFCGLGAAFSDWSPAFPPSTPP